MTGRRTKKDLQQVVEEENRKIPATDSPHRHPIHPHTELAGTGNGPRTSWILRFLL